PGAAAGAFADEPAPDGPDFGSTLPGAASPEPPLPAAAAAAAASPAAPGGRGGAAAAGSPAFGGGAAAPTSAWTPEPAPARDGAGGDSLAALLRQAGIDPADVDAATLASVGDVLHVVVEGLMDVLRARTAIKNQFRVA